jgi:predicted kinase
MIIIVSGLPGSGKSYFATRLATRLNAVYISSDRIRKSIGRMGLYTFEDKLVVYRHMAVLAGAAVDSGQEAVVDATFYHRTFRELFINLALQTKVGICFIEVVADEAIVRERLDRPRGESEADFQVYQQLKGQFERYEDPHLVLQSGNNTIDKNLVTALEYIREIHEGS